MPHNWRSKPPRSLHRNLLYPHHDIKHPRQPPRDPGRGHRSPQEPAKSLQLPDGQPRRGRPRSGNGDVSSVGVLPRERRAERELVVVGNPRASFVLLHFLHGVRAQRFHTCRGTLPSDRESAHLPE